MVSLVLPNFSLDTVAKVATIIAAIVAITALPYIVFNMSVSLEQLESNEMATNQLIKLIGAIENQTKVLESTSDEIKHQTLVGSFSGSGGYNLGVYRCSSINPQPDENGDDIYSMSYFPVIRDREGDPTAIPFYIYLTFYFWYEYNHDGSGKDIVDTQRVSQYLLVPSDRNALHLDFTEAIKNAEERDYSHIRVLLASHSFAPYSPVKDELLAEYSSTHEDIVFTEIRFLGDEWDVNHPKDSICANSLDK